jgi:hypothetical protein
MCALLPRTKLGNRVSVIALLRFHEPIQIVWIVCGSIIDHVVQIFYFESNWFRRCFL